MVYNANQFWPHKVLMKAELIKTYNYILYSMQTDQ